jgi:adenosylhomocysteine nucleosidase
MKRIGIIAALSGELKPLVRGWPKRGRNLWVGRVGECEAAAIAGGIGAKATERAAEHLFAEFEPEALVSYGWAGALTCAVKPPTACAISEVIDACTDRCYTTQFARGYRLLTLDRVAGADEKRGLAEKYQSVLVDMEAAAVARIARARNVPFFCFKGVSDGYNDQLPDFSRFIDDAGELRMAAFMAYAAVRPKYWPSMQRLGKNSRAAATALAGLLEECMKE